MARCERERLTMALPSNFCFVICRFNRTFNRAEYFQEGVGATTTSANATLYAHGQQARDRGAHLGGDDWVAVPAICAQNWTAR